MNIVIEVLNLKKNEIISLDATNPAILEGQYDIICYYSEIPQNEQDIAGEDYSFKEFKIKIIIKRKKYLLQIIIII